MLLQLYATNISQFDWDQIEMFTRPEVESFPEQEVVLPFSPVAGKQLEILTLGVETWARGCTGRKQLRTHWAKHSRWFLLKQLYFRHEIYS